MQGDAKCLWIVFGSNEKKTERLHLNVHSNHIDFINKPGVHYSNQPTIHSYLDPFIGNTHGEPVVKSIPSFLHGPTQGRHTRHFLENHYNTYHF